MHRLCPAPENKDYFFKAGDPVWKHLPVIPAPGKVKQEDLEFKTSLSYISRSCLKQKMRDNERKERKVFMFHTGSRGILMLLMGRNTWLAHECRGGCQGGGVPTTLGSSISLRIATIPSSFRSNDPSLNHVPGDTAFCDLSTLIEGFKFSFHTQGNYVLPLGLNLKLSWITGIAMVPSHHLRKQYSVVRNIKKKIMISLYSSKSSSVFYFQRNGTKHVLTFLF